MYGYMYASACIHESVCMNVCMCWRLCMYICMHTYLNANWCVYTYTLEYLRVVRMYVLVSCTCVWAGLQACMHASVCSFTPTRHDTLSGDEPCSKENITLPPPRSLLRQDFFPAIPAPVRCPAMGERPFSRFSHSFPRCAREILARTIGPRPSGDSGPSLLLSCACSLLLFL